jgi:two-component system sensor histidine kinase BaeS
VRTLVWAIGLVLAAGVIVAEMAMPLTPGDRLMLYSVFAGMGLVTALAALVALRVAPRLRSLMTSIRLVAFAALVVAAGAVALSAVTMFIDPHDLNLVLVALLLGVGLAGVLAVAVAGPLTGDLAELAAVAERVGAGDLSVQTGIRRRDELGAAAQALDGMVARLAASEEERRMLLAAVGHDLRTPLSSLQAAVEAMQDGVAPDPTAYLRGMSHDLDLLRRLVDDLFLLARIEAGRLDLHPEAIDLSELADEAVEAVAPAAARKRVHLEVETPGRVNVVADPAALGRVFRNLLSNAIRHTPTGSTVTIKLGHRDGMIEALVIDQGSGFSPEMRARAFDRFVHADDSRNREAGGTGLGLAIAKGILDSHGGGISIDDGPGGRVRFALPGG